MHVHKLQGVRSRRTALRPPTTQQHAATRTTSRFATPFIDQCMCQPRVGREKNRQTRPRKKMRQGSG